MKTKTVVGQETLKTLAEGHIIEYGDRYLKYDSEKNEIFYSDDLREWNSSKISANQLLKYDWNVIK